nr:RNA-directed DNA polymerase, eukaryota, reverse transcriptase zinc-binding domain protein [Tanacetum cinerariifolium]GEV91515.1 RNA-directed DNA polymerase, eukaryota, reverse transcriptase zinc-binding domain protein [Tanacetum cinerariifolium]
MQRNTQSLKGNMEMFINKLSEEEAIGMILQVAELEIKQAMFDIDNDKAPSPDGFTSCLFKKAWPIVGKDVSDAIKEFFLTGKLLKECIGHSLKKFYGSLDFMSKCYSKKAWDAIKGRTMLDKAESYVYAIWREMNLRIFQDKKRNEDVLIREVKEKQEKDKIGSKPDKNEKRGKARQCRKPIIVKKEENTSSRDKKCKSYKEYTFKIKEKG